MAKRSLPLQLTKRMPLQEMIPLDTPFSVLLSPFDNCNLKCVFCPFHGVAAQGSAAGALRESSKMPFELFDRIARQLAQFPGRVKALIFCGRGEPTLHEDLPRMIKLAKELEITDSVRCTTNGTALTKPLIDALCDAGLDYMKISVPGTDEQTIFDITERHVDLTEYVGNIRYLFERKSENMTVYCKTANTALGATGSGEPDPLLKDRFYKMFEGISDYCHIENIIPYAPDMPKEKLEAMGIGGFDGRNTYGLEREDSTAVSNPICERLFYHLTISSIGDVFPCDINESSNLLLGNVQDSDLVSIWHSEELRELQRAFVKGDIPNSCRGCGGLLYDYPNELHGYRDVILEALMRADERGRSSLQET